MKLNFETYKDKVRAAWIGKNIGGTMGGPYEGKREVLDCRGFSTEKGKALPNDDLDLQLVWLHAMESVGPYELDCNKLGEFWLSFLPPHWNEYGIGKNNMKHGLIPPLSGDYRNPWKHSNGAWIRTEIWATLSPACPDVAALYAIEDAVVDHGAGEGTVAAAFVAAMQSAAFVESDLRTVIEIGLSRVPETSRLAQSVRKVLECYDGGLSWLDTRNTVLNMNMDIGNGWFEAPSNVAYAVLGMVFGEGDFKQSMIMAINCGDDTDCTAATVGATLGILGGTAAIPQDWAEYIGDDIVTISIATGVYRSVPTTCSELTERVVALAPSVLYANTTEVSFTDAENEIPSPAFPEIGEKSEALQRLRALKPYQYEIDLTLFRARITWDASPDITPNGEIGVAVNIWSKKTRYEKPGCSKTKLVFGNAPYFLNFRWMLPEGFTVDGVKNASLSHINSHGTGDCEVHFTVHAGDKVESLNRLVLEVVADGRCLPGYIPFTLMG